MTAAHAFWFVLIGSPKLFRLLAVSVGVVAARMIPLASETAERVLVVQGFTGDFVSEELVPIGFAVADWAILQLVAAAIVFIHPTRTTAKRWVWFALASSIVALVLFAIDHLHPASQGMLFSDTVAVHRFPAVYSVMRWGVISGLLLFVALPLALLVEHGADHVPRAVASGT